jgi:hypothetical protein
MSTFYFEGEVKAPKTPKIGAWELVVAFKRAFGEVSATTVTSDALATTFYVKLSIPKINDHDDNPETDEKIQNIFMGLEDDPDFLNIKLCNDNSKIVDMLDQAESKPAPQADRAVSPASVAAMKERWTAPKEAGSSDDKNERGYKPN